MTAKARLTPWLFVSAGDSSPALRTSYVGFAATFYPRGENQAPKSQPSHSPGPGFVRSSPTASNRGYPPIHHHLYDKIWDDHVVDTQPDGTCLLYIDRHLVHEVAGPGAASRVCA